MFRILKSSKPASFSFSAKIINFILSPHTNMILATIIIFLFLITTSSSWVEDDVQCLRNFKSSVSDPQGYLLSWNFSDTSYGGSMCNFFGVSCWNSWENRILSLSLSSTSLTGTIASVLDSLFLCSSITSLNLSFNSFTGSIPATIPKSLSFLVHLNLSSNSLTGNIPPSLSDCTFLNSLNLSANHLSGSIPALLSNLIRLSTLDLSSNSLSGPVPVGLAKFGTARFRNNPWLCGYPVSSACPKPPTQTRLGNIIFINLASGVFGFLLSLSISYVFTSLGFFPESLALKKKTNRASSTDNRVSGSRRWSRSSSHGERIPVSLFRKPLVELTLADLMAATEDFHPDNIVIAGSCNLGTAFKAVLSDGSTLVVKRLQECLLSEHHFRVEMGRIGQICHPNLAVLLGFCIAEERLLIYKDPGNGALSSRLHAGDENLDWPTRLRIATGVARGLAWLHHGFQVPLLHQKFNSSAILLDEDYEPKIADFGLARLMNMNLSVIANTPLPTTKGDVYEFGMVLLELATERKAMEAFEDLVTWVTNLYLADRILEAIDESLRGKGNDDEIVEFLKVACECVVARPHEWPSMYEVYGSLKRIGSGLEILEQFDEPSVVCSKDVFDATELVKLAYCMYTGENPFS